MRFVKPMRQDLQGFFEANDLIGLRAFGALNDVELYGVAFFEALIAFELNRAVVDEDIGTIVASEKTISFCIVKPLDLALVL